MPFSVRTISSPNSASGLSDAPAADVRRWRITAAKGEPPRRSPAAGGNPGFTSPGTERARQPACLSGAWRLVGDPLRPLGDRGEIAGLDQFVRLERVKAPELVAARLTAAMVRESGSTKTPAPSYCPNIQ